MELSALIVLVVVVALLLTLAFTRIAADAVLLGALTVLLVVPVPVDGSWQIGVMSVRDAFSGFGNTGLATVAVMFIVVVGLQETGAIDWIAARLLGRPKTVRGAITRIFLPVTSASAFMNNTPLVAMMIPAINDWSKRLRFSPSKLMMPLSYAAILGGTCSLIGTSTNLVVAGLVIAHTDLPPLKMFDITWIGIPAALVGGAYLILIAPKLLPDRGSREEAIADPREYTLELVIPAGSPLDGKSIHEAGLRNLPGCYLVDVERGDETLGAVSPEQTLRAGDRLVFAGIVDAIRDVQRLRGLEPATDQVFKLSSPRFRRRLFEAVISPSSPLNGRTIREGRFRNRYQGVVLAVTRDGRRIPGRLGDIELRPGDTVLVEADGEFALRYRNSRDFLLVSPLADSTPRRHQRAPLAIAILVAMVVAASFGWVDMLVAALVASGLMIATRCCTISEARSGVDWSVLVVIGAALGLGTAIEVSGAAQVVADAALGIAGDHPWAALIAVYLVTMFMTEMITNNGAVALVFPIALSIAQQLGVSFLPFVFAIMMAGSASFATPIGYQTNMMVYGPGGYRFTDFLKVGGLLNLILAITTCALIPFIWKF